MQERRSRVPSRASVAAVGPAVVATDKIKAQPGTSAWVREAQGLEDKLIEQAWREADEAEAAAG